MNIVARLVAVLLVLGPAIAWSQAPPGDTPPSKEEATARRLAQEGSDFAKKGQWREAAVRFEASLQLFPILDVYYNLAYVYENLGDWKGCVDNYTRYLEAYRKKNQRDPAEVLSIQRSIDKCKETAQPPVTITTNPIGATVSLGTKAKVIGTTPVTIKLDPGTHKIFVEKEGYKPVVTEIKVLAKQEQKYQFDLQRVLKVGKVRVWVNVRDATLYIDGKNYGITPYTATPELEAGSHQIVIKKDEYTTVNATFDIVANKTTDLKYKIYLKKPPPSWRSYVGWASVSIGVVSIAGGIVAFKFADEKFNDTDDFKQLKLLQDLGYGLGGSLLGVGVALLIWEALTDRVRPDDELRATRAPSRPSLLGFGVTPTDGGVYMTGQMRF